MTMFYCIIEVLCMYHMRAGRGGIVLSISYFLLNGGSTERD